MEEQEILQTEIGTKEKEKLEPAVVKIVKLRIEHIEKAKSQKVIFEVKHPGREKNVNLSSVSYLVGKELVTYGTWINFDDDNKIQKGSALAVLLNHLEINKLADIVGKTIDTTLEGRYLCFKAY